MATKSKMNVDFAALQATLLAQFRGLDPKDPSMWPALPRYATFFAVMVLVVVGLWFAWLNTSQTELEAEQATEVKLRDDYKFKLAKAVNLDVLRKQREQVLQYVTQLEKQLPSKAEMDALLSDINQAGIGRSLQFELFRPGQVAVKDYYAELPITLRVSGRYHDMGSFASDIANLSRIVTLNNLSIAPRPDGSLVMDATAKTFRYLDANEVAAQRKAQPTPGLSHEHRPAARRCSAPQPAGRRYSCGTARPPEGARHRSPQGEGTPGGTARPPEGHRRRSLQGDGSRFIGYRVACMLLVGLALAACGGSSGDELQKWMADQRNLTRPKVTPIAEPKVFKPESYQQAGVLEPFSKEKLTQALSRDGAQVVSNAGLVAPELARRKQPLEAFPLDAMTLVGSMVQAGRPVALVRVNSLLYQVRPGDYLGLNYGLVTKISETEVALREIVQDAVGEWIERTASLQLQERSK